MEHPENADVLKSLLEMLESEEVPIELKHALEPFLREIRIPSEHVIPRTFARLARLRARVDKNDMLLALDNSEIQQETFDFYKEAYDSILALERYHTGVEEIFEMLRDIPVDTALSAAKQGYAVDNTVEGFRLRNEANINKINDALSRYKRLLKVPTE